MPYFCVRYAHTDELQLLAECQPHKDLKAGVLGFPSAAVTAISFSADGAQILSTHANGHVQLFHLFGSLNEVVIHVRAPGPPDIMAHRDPFPVKILQSVMYISFVDLMRPSASVRSRNKSAAAVRKEQLKEGASTCFIECATFFPSFSMTSMQHSSIVVGTRSGVVVKYNLRESKVFYAPTAAAFEPPGMPGVNKASDGQLLKEELARMERVSSVAGTDRGGMGRLFGDPRSFIRREFFEGHQMPILSIGFTGKTSASTSYSYGLRGGGGKSAASANAKPTSGHATVSNANTAPVMVTVDTMGTLFEWIYSSDHFSGFGWFTPTRRFVFDLLNHDPTTTNPRPAGLPLDRLRAAYVRTNANEVHFVTERQGSTCLCFADLETGQLWPKTVEIPGGLLLGSGGSDNMDADPNDRGRGRGRGINTLVCYLPGLDGAKSDYCYVVANRAIRVFSLASGSPVRQFPLPQEFRQPIMCIVGQRHVLVADVDKHVLQLFQVHAGTNDALSPTSQMHRQYSRRSGAVDLDSGVAEQSSFRMRRLLPEFRIRTEGETAWDLAEKHALHEIQKIVYKLVDDAVEESLNQAAFGVYNTVD